MNGSDFAIWLVAFFSTLFLGIVIGLGVALAVSLVLVVYKSAFPRIGGCQAGHGAGMLAAGAGQELYAWRFPACRCTPVHRPPV